MRFEPLPRYKLQNVGEYCIVMRHGDDLQSCPGTLADVQNRLESTPCALSTKSKPDSRGSSPRMTPIDASTNPATSSRLPAPPPPRSATPATAPATGHPPAPSAPPPP